MNLTRLLDTIKQHPDYHQAGMILCHNGVVRSTSRDGRKVFGLTISVDNDKLEQVIESNKQTLGIIEILVEFNENRKLAVEDDVMLLVVAGDIRETVIRVLTDTLNAIKKPLPIKPNSLNNLGMNGTNCMNCSLINMSTSSTYECQSVEIQETFRHNGPCMSKLQTMFINKSLFYPVLKCKTFL